MDTIDVISSEDLKQTSSLTSSLVEDKTDIKSKALKRKYNYLKPNKTDINILSENMIDFENQKIKLKKIKLNLLKLDLILKIRDYERTGVETTDVKQELNDIIID